MERSLQFPFRRGHYGVRRGPLGPEVYILPGTTQEDLWADAANLGVLDPRETACRAAVLRELQRRLDTAAG